VGVNLHLPNPWLFASLDLEAATPPDGEPSYARTKKKDLLAVSRLGLYHDLTDASSLSLGGSLAYGPAGFEVDAVNLSSTTLWTTLTGVDLTFKWKEPSRAIYRSLLFRTEALFNRRGIAPGTVVRTWGLFSHLEWQFARRWRIGGRYDWTQQPTVQDETSGALAYLTFTPSEFSLVSLQGRVVDRPGGTDTTGWLKATFNIGPHGAHPF